MEQYFTVQVEIDGKWMDVSNGIRVPYLEACDIQGEVTFPFNPRSRIVCADHGEDISLTGSVCRQCEGL